MDIQDYIASLIPIGNDPFIERIEKYASDHNVPIMEKTGLHMLLQILELHQPRNILEIGTAIGYSAIKMAQSLPANIVTIERDIERLKIAKENITEAGLHERIKVIEGDALDLQDEVSAFAPYDAVFIDAAKGQYEKFFQLYEPMISTGGLVISDNILFKGMVAGEVPSHKRIEGMVQKLRSYNEKLMSDPRFSSMIYPIGDGVLVSIKKG
ncbi:MULTISPECIES: O-methyltransferase [Bacillaceae]|uniref:tRNA 5-hydroxyuridine methyltransferase n=1 Tax=Evansella alkalicola TaxID=745819 RepID=A0ABS6JQ33_9BACI|nr:MULTISPECIES: O-methyltransferase [Bacillaceae]MBU9720662.1 O-methyltransferase [Bacillus alkalicola]